jgi:phage baseplate assembly protein V
MEDVMDLREAIRLGLVQSIDDTGQVQRAVVQTHDSGSQEIDVFQLDGIASSPQVDGAIALVFSIGNDASHRMCIIANPSTRYGNQLAGERAIAMPDGTRVAVRQGGIVEIWGGNLVKINAPSMQVSASGAVQITAGGGVGITGNVTITGSASVTGNLVVDGNATVAGTFTNP